MTHEGLRALFVNRPTLAAEMLRDVFGEKVPSFHEARIKSTDLTEIVPADRRTDVLVVLDDEQERPVLGIVVEVQLHRDPDKPYVWPAYVSQARAQHRCSTWLMVVTIEPEMVGWCSRPIEMGHPGWVLKPLVLGPAAQPASDRIGPPRHLKLQPLKRGGANRVRRGQRSFEDGHHGGREKGERTGLIPIRARIWNPPHPLCNPRRVNSRRRRHVVAMFVTMVPRRDGRPLPAHAQPY